MGTVHQGEDVYRILPYLHHQEHAVFRIDDQKQSASGLMNNRTDVDRSKAERRHVQLAEIADLQPREFITAKDGRLSHIVDDDLGKMDLASVGPLANADPGAVVAPASKFLSENSALTGIHEKIDLILGYVSPGNPTTGERAAISLDQTINGIPVEGAGYDFSLDPITGTVVAMGRSLATNDMVETNRANWYTQEEARELAMREVSALWPGAAALKMSKPELLYRWVGDSDVDPFWRLILKHHAVGPQIIHVNAIDGSVSANPYGFHLGH